MSAEEALIAGLRAVSREAAPCKICGADAPLYGVVDFHRSCEEVRGRHLPLSGIPIYYRRCPRCGFLFTESFDDWTDAEFKKYIYNDGYLAVDPDYAGGRAAHQAGILQQLFRNDKGRLRVLDYGGGNGTLAELLPRAGFRAAATYDPFTPAHEQSPVGRFEVITCFETFEHMADPKAGIAAIANHLDEPGIVVMSTVFQPANINRLKMNWWYIGPRNGHISLFSRRALAIAWRNVGFVLATHDDNLHIAYRRLPDFARHLLPDSQVSERA